MRKRTSNVLYIHFLSPLFLLPRTPELSELELG
jgi:hypothetical protein